MAAEQENGISNIDVYASLTGEKRAKIEDVSFGRLRADTRRNPREIEVYTDSRNEFLARSMHDFGYNVNEPLWVSKRPDGFYWVLRGHRRYHALKTLIENGLKAVGGTSPLPAVDPNPERFAKVRCQIYTGLTAREELDILMDHGGIVKLNEKEQVLAAREMSANGFTHEMIAAKLGMSRSNYTNGLGKFFILPGCVMEHFLTADEKNKLPKVTQGVRKLLVEEYGKDQKLPGARIRVGGPSFMKAWEDFLVNGAPTPEKALSREQIKSLFATLSDTTDRDITDLLQAIHDGNQLNASTAVTRLKMALKIAGDTVGTDRVVIEEGIIKPIVNEEYTEAVNA